MIRHEGLPNSAEQKAHVTLDKMAHALAEAVAAVEPENSTTSPLEIFPEPGERRADTEYSLPPEQEMAFREAMARLGIGRESNINATEAGLKDGYIAVIEGGQAHKMIAELNVVLSDKITRPRRIIITATPDRPIKPVEEDKAKEREVTASVLGIDNEEVGETELDVAKQVAVHTPNFQPIRPMYDFTVAYNTEGDLISEGVKDGEGKLSNIGTIIDTPIDILQIDRQYLDDGKYKVLGSKGIMQFVTNLLDLWGFDSDVGFVTSATYQPSRETDASSVMLEIERQGNPRNVGVVTYGTQELAKVKLAKVKKEDYPTPVALGQLAGEAHKAARQLEALKALLES